MQLNRVHTERQQLIKHCIKEVSGTVATLRQQREKSEDPALTMSLRKEQNKVNYFWCEGFG
jgi:hypothetical protein